MYIIKIIMKLQFRSTLWTIFMLIFEWNANNKSEFKKIKYLFYFNI